MQAGTVCYISLDARLIPTCEFLGLGNDAYSTVAEVATIRISASKQHNSDHEPDGLQVYRQTTCA